MHAIEVAEAGGPEQLRWVEVEDPAPGPGQLLVRPAAIGLNFIETYQRSGVYPVEHPFRPGGEGSGEVVAIAMGTLREKMREMEGHASLSRLADAIVGGTSDPYVAADLLVAELAAAD